MELIIIGMVALVWLSLPRRGGGKKIVGQKKWTTDFVPPPPRQKAQAPTEPVADQLIKKGIDSYSEASSEAFVRMIHERRERAKSKEYLFAPVFALALLLLLAAGVVWVYSNIIVH